MNLERNINIMTSLFSNFLRILNILSSSIRKEIFLLLVSMILLGLIELISITTLSLFVKILNNPDAVASSHYTKTIIAFFPLIEDIVYNTNALLIVSVCIPIISILIKNAFSAYVTWKTGLIGGHVAGYIGVEMMKIFLFMPYDWHLSEICSDACIKMSWRYQLGEVLIQSLIAYSNFITAIILFSGLFIYAPDLTLIVIFVMLTSSVALYALIKRKVDRASDDNAYSFFRESDVTSASVNGIREILIYQQQDIFISELKKAVNKSLQPRAFLQMAPPIPSFVLETIGFILIGVTLSWLLLYQKAGLPEITSSIAMLTLTAWRVLPSLNKAVGAIVNIRTNQSMGIPCLEFLEYLKKQKIVRNDCTQNDIIFNKSIDIHNIHYTYPDSTIQSLKGVTLSIGKGQSIGIIGKSGAGKSTLINIISGLLKPSQGQISVDGKELSSEEMMTFRKRIGYVPQTPYIMNGTIAENIAFSEWGKDIDPKRVQEACRLAGIDFVGPNFEGLTRRIGENGSGLSGGQAQRITIARALYSNPQIIILDEATSSLDYKTQSYIHDAISKLPDYITTIIVAHNMAAVKDCEKIYWIENGKVKDAGEAEIILKRYHKN